MPVQAIHHINIRASKALVGELRDFYQSVLGLRDGWRPPFQSTGHWLYLGDLPLIHLVEDELAGASARSGSPNIDHVAFACVGLRQFKDLLRAKGIAYRQTEVPTTSLVQLMFSDPAGNGVELQFVEGDS